MTLVNYLCSLRYEVGCEEVERYFFKLDIKHKKFTAEDRRVQQAGELYALK